MKYVADILKKIYFYRIYNENVRINIHGDFLNLFQNRHFLDLMKIETF